MAYKVGTILLELKADIAKLIKGMNKAERAIHKATSKMQNYFNALIGAWATFEATVGATKIAKNFIDTAAEFEKMSVAMQTLTGNAKLAKENMNWIVDFASKTPYQLNQVTEAFIKLKSYGINAKDDLKILGDTASAMGKSLDQAVEAIADAVTGQFERLKEFGIKSQQLNGKVAFQWTTTSGQIKHIVIQNNAKIIESTLKAIWNSKYAGGMEQQSKTWTGLWSNIQDDFTKFKLALMNSGIFDYLKAVVAVIKDKLDNALKNNNSTIKTLGANIVEVIKSFIKGLSHIYQYSQYIKIPFLAIKLAWLGLKEAIAAVELEFTNFVNKAIEAYNKLSFLAKIKKVSKGSAAKDYLNIQKEIKQTEVDIYNAENTKPLYDADKLLKDVQLKLKEIKSASKETKEQIVRDVKGAQDGALSSTALSTKKMKNYWEQYYKTIGNMQQAWLHSTTRQEALELVKKLNLNKKQREEYLKKVKEKYIGTVKKVAKQTVTIFDEVSKQMYDSFNSTFFDAIEGRFRSFKSFLKSLFNDIYHSILDPFARSISSFLASGLTSFLGFAAPSGSIAKGQKVDAKALLTQGFKALSDNVYQDATGHKIVLNQSGQVEGIYGATGSPISQLPGVVGTLSKLKTGVGLITNPTAAIAGLQYSIASPFYYGGQTLVDLGATSLGQGVAGFGFGLTHPFTSGAASMAGGAGIGAMAGQVLVGGALGYLGGTVLDKLFGADTHADIGAGAGAAIGSLIMPGIGTAIGALAGGLLGSVLGGLFGKTRVTGTAKGIDIFGIANANNVSGRYWGRTDYKKSSWFHSKSWSEYRYKNFTELDKLGIEKVFKVYDSLLLKMGEANHYLQVRGGRFSNIEDFLNRGVTKSFLGKLVNPWHLNDVYKIWQTYAKAVNKKVYEALSEEIGKYIQATRSFKSWLYGYKGDTVGQLRYAKDVANQDLQAIRETIGWRASNVTIDNYLYAYKQAIKNNLTPDEIESWKQLGDALKTAAEAQKAYQTALEKQEYTLRQLTLRTNLLFSSLGSSKWIPLGTTTSEITNQILEETTNSTTLQRIYDAWKRYADVVNKTVSEAVISGAESFVNFQHSFKSWYLGFTGDSAGQLKYLKDIAEQQVEALKKTIGADAANVTIDNFLDAYNKAIKKKFTPEVLQEWQQLGKALEEAAAAEKKYNAVLTSNTNILSNGLNDMMLYKAHDATQLNVQELIYEIKSQNSENKILFLAILKELKKQTALQQGL